MAGEGNEAASRPGDAADTPARQPQDARPIGDTDAARSVTVLLHGGFPDWFTEIMWGIVWGYFLIASWGEYVYPFVGWTWRWVLIGLFACVGGVALVAQRRAIPRLTVAPDRLRLCEGGPESRWSRIWHEIDRQQVASVELEWYPSGATPEHGVLSIRCRDGRHYTVIDVSSRRRLRRVRRVLMRYGWPAASVIKGDLREQRPTAIPR